MSLAIYAKTVLRGRGAVILRINHCQWLAKYHLEPLKVLIQDCDWVYMRTGTVPSRNYHKDIWSVEQLPPFHII